MNKYIFGSFISVLILFSKKSFAQDRKLDSTIIRVDTFSIDYIVFADSVTGVLMKKNKQIVIRKTTIKRTSPLNLAKQESESQLFDQEEKK